ncbi:MAG TPA: hypothetical protein VNL39_00015 [Xanthobacteraceae bacterium]|nr:hypothetical protein [Xanthobacteraceae bacterium]
MRKLLVGVVAAIIVIAGGGYFGWELLAQFRTKSEVEAVFESLRTSFPTAKYGRVELALKARAVKIADIVLQSSDRTATIRIGQIAATDTRGPVGGRIAAGRIEINDWEFTFALPMSGAPSITYRAPNIIVESFSGPAALPVKFDSASVADLARVSLEYIAASTATRIVVPTLTAKVATRPQEPPTSGVPLSADYTYSDVMLRDIGGGRIAEIRIERATITSDQLTPALGSVASVMARISLSDFHVGNLAALFASAKAKEDAYLPIYRRASLGPFEVRYAAGGGVQIDEMTVDDIAVRPSKLSLSNILAIAEAAPRPGSQPSPGQTRATIDQVASLYEGIRIGKFELRGMRVRMIPDVNFNLDAFRLRDLENGRLAEFAMEGLEGRSRKNEPVHLGLLVFRGLHITNLLRQTARLADSSATPFPDALIGVLTLLEGIEVKDLRVVPQNTQQTIRIEFFRLSWGKFVGSIPSAVRFSAKTTVPTDLADIPAGGALSEAGFASITTNVDFGITWDESAQTLLISPVIFEVDHAFAFSAELALRNVPRSAFAANPATVVAVLDQLEVGPLQISLRDSGALRTALSQYAKNNKMSVDEALKEIIDSVNEVAKASAQKNPEVVMLSQALVQFIESPGSTLTVRITPKEPVKFKQLIEKGNGDPLEVAVLFDIEVKTTQ